MASPQPSALAADRPLVLDLAGLTGASWTQVGGKAAHLGELIAAGLPVPPGFCLTTDAYAQAADAAGLSGQAAGPITAADAAALRARLRAVPIPGRISAQVAAAYAGLGADVPVAVRSSATAEDLPDASFAGQQDTYLNVVGTAAVLEAVRSCWASLWTERAVAYRASAGTDRSTVRLAVVVQVMVDARVAGVAFTADPVTGARGRTVIDASPGLGEAVVSGAVNPDHFVIDATGRIVEQRLGDKRVEIRALPGGGTQRRDRPADATPCLTAAQLARIAAVGARVQEHYGAPQDLEWAIDASGAVWLTQARPITTLFPLPEPASPGHVYFCVSLAQGLVRPLTPMGISAFQVVGAVAAHHLFDVPLGDPRLGPRGFATAGGRLFVDATPALRSRVGRALVPRVFDVMEARSAVVLRSLLDDPIYAVEKSAWWPLVRRVARLSVRFRIPLRLLRALASPAAGRRHLARVDVGLATVTAVRPGLTAAQRLGEVERLLRGVYPLLLTVVPVPAAGFAMLEVARRLAGPDLAADDVHEVLRSLPHNVTTQMNLALWALAVRIRESVEAAAAVRDETPTELAERYHRGALPAVLQHGVAGFLRAHGHHAVAEIDLGMPRWSDDPAYLFGVLAGYLRLAADRNGLAPDAQFARGERSAAAAIATVVGRVRWRSRPRAAAVGFALGRVRALAGMRETHKDQLIRVFAAARTQLGLVGQELAGRGLLDDPADIFFLDLVQAAEAVAGADLRSQVERRRTDYDRELRRRQVPRVMCSDGTQPEAVRTPAAGAAGALIGSPASAGVVTAPARVVLDPDDARLEPGEILVAPSTDPGWTPLFLTAGGLVMEMGGANSHGAVVAREYGIPAVVGVPDATALLATGDMITVDGAAGSIVRADPRG
ncbi:PEP/pyruvate-binding domain-containing protein [Pseudonocardia asaccharolytica]|uniref:Phosphoenolpyruvate synthase n=1 Tax=Pseudonocardia asaccharolytica DSM 44247 = NBRC 16224 TaxID=1123024 RepID=A0A511D9I2_9PSEU|nr:PEP/pyruvate-binding domain-containing protein [Pseudonocardia asaccharolytica]GEL19608.1 phosphoenolpyruvate synthase [Pseudonocardia asaccharolytica DSM 44247 = NBRC 16224]